MSDTLKLRPGRPKGSKNGISVRKWQPKEWKFEYETVLLMHVCGKTHSEIAEVCQLGEQQINNILNSELCRNRKEQLKSKLGVTEVIEGYKNIMEMAVNRMKEFLEDKGTFKSYPVGAVSVAMKMFEMFDGKLNPGVRLSAQGSINVTNNNNTVFLATEDAVKRLTAADAFSSAVMEIHGKRIAEVPAVSGITGK